MNMLLHNIIIILTTMTKFLSLAFNASLVIIGLYSCKMRGKEMKLAEILHNLECATKQK